MTYGNGNGQQFQRKIPELGKGRLRKPRGPAKHDANGRVITPDFTGLINFEGQILSASIWYNPATPGQNGQMMPESFAVKVARYDPNQQGQAPQQPMQQQMPYAPPQQPAYAPANAAPAYAPPPQQGYQQPPQQGGYAPAPGYQPQGQPPQQPPRWGGQPGAQAQPATMQAQGGYKPSDVPFMMER